MSSTSTSTRVSGLRWVVAAVVVAAIGAGIVGIGEAHASDDVAGPSVFHSHGAPQAQQAEDPDPEANLPYLFAVYIITWGGFFGYIFFMGRRQKEMQRELDALKSALADKESPTEQGEQQP